jgi:hypothetical protein
MESEDINHPDYRPDRFADQPLPSHVLKTLLENLKIVGHLFRAVVTGAFLIDPGTVTGTKLKWEPPLDKKNQLTPWLSRVTQNNLFAKISQLTAKHLNPIKQCRGGLLEVA